MLYNRISFCFLILITILISGCSAFRPSFSSSITQSQRQLTPTFTSTSKPNMISTLAPTYIPSFTPITAIPTLTYTPVPSTPNQTLTPLPTLTDIQRKDYFSELLKNNAGCRLPCWWGITPGKSTWEEAHSLINFMGFGQSTDPQSNGSIYHGAGYDWHEPLITNSFGFYENEGIIEVIDILTDGYYDKNQFRILWNSYSPDQILATYGPPTEVYIGASQGIGGVDSGIVFRYDDEFMLIYNSKPLLMEVDDIPIFRICPSWQDITWEPELHMFIKSVGFPLSFEEFINQISSFPIEQLIPIEEATNITADEFYQRFKPGYGPACVDTPQDMWK